MKFSDLEKTVIKHLCEWANCPDEFKATRNFIADMELAPGTGVFVFSKEIEDRPSTILCIDTNKHKEDEYDSIINNLLFVFYFLKKLERLGLVTISEGGYSKEKEYALGIFQGASVIGITRSSKAPDWSYQFNYFTKNEGIINAELIKNSLTIRRKDTGVPLSFNNFELFCRFETFDLVSSNIAVGQELFELVANNFTSYEEQMLEAAKKQLKAANQLLEKSEIQTSMAIESIELSKNQFETAQAEAKNQFDQSQQTAKKNFESANCKSKFALLLAVVSIIAAPIVAIVVPTKLNSEQFKKLENSQTKEIYQLENVNSKIEGCNSSIVDAANRIDSLSSIAGRTENNKSNR